MSQSLSERIRRLTEGVQDLAERASPGPRRIVWVHSEHIGCGTCRVREGIGANELNGSGRVVLDYYRESGMVFATRQRLSENDGDTGDVYDVDGQKLGPVRSEGRIVFGLPVGIQSLDC